MIAGKRQRICVVDDDETVRSVISQILELRYAVDAFSNAEDFITNADIPTLDAVITDVQLPGLTGIESIRLVHEKDDTIPVIVVTGMGDFETAISALKQGAFDFIVKPFHADQILISVEKALERRMLYLENRKLVHELTEKNRQLEILYHQMNDRNTQIERDLDIASNLQDSLFPASFPSINGVSFSLRMKPAEKISGDFFDIIEVSPSKFMFIFADVSGHGVPAALYSAMMKSAIVSLQEKNLSPSEWLREVNHYLITSQKKMSYSYATLFCAFFNLDQGSIIYSNAGIPAPVILKTDGSRTHLNPTGPFVGLFEAADYDEVQIDIVSGDRMLIFSDGAYEVGMQSMTGYDTLVDYIDEIRSKQVSEIVESIYERLFMMLEGKPIRDDATIVGIEIKSFDKKQ
ncbi:MAG TPA: SpoIIE family protein phosphatase [Spirochaetota bacterium]|nr:SpoIIE family protein phosphatase [Spirochaetota bacterium]